MNGEGQTGRAYLVGAGPGDPGLLTARALELIASADVILYDRLIPSSAIDGARADALLVDVGKTGGGSSIPQEETTAALIGHARAGRTVVRLKGGDPFVFGRGGEEALALRDAGVPFEIVPGVTAGVAAAAYAGIPVTHRDRASAVALVTGHENPDKPDSAIDWSALGAFPGTLVFYMGVRELERIAAALVECGRPPEESVAVVQRGTLPGQRTVTGTLATIAATARAAEIEAPAITIVGSVTELAQELTWRGPQPLAGVTVAVTRARTQASGLARELEGLGATVIQAPLIRIEELQGPALDLHGVDLLCLTSPNGVRLFFARLHAAGFDARALHGITVAAVGPGTARALAEHGITPDVVPERFVAEGLVEALTSTPVDVALIAGPKAARDVLGQALRDRGAEVRELNLYRTVAEPLTPADRDRLASADYVTFTSGSTVEFLMHAVGDAASTLDARLVSIGPITSDALRAHGLEPHAEADPHDIAGLVAAIVDDVARR